MADLAEYWDVEWTCFLMPDGKARGVEYHVRKRFQPGRWYRGAWPGAEWQRVGRIRAWWLRRTLNEGERLMVVTT